MSQGLFGNVPSDRQTSSQVVNLPNKPNVIDANGKKQGEWAKKYRNGRYAYTATFVDDVPVGPVVRYTEKGEKSSVQIFSGDTCHTTTFHSNGKTESKGIYIHKLKEGEWLFFGSEGELIERSNYTHGELNGLQTIYFDNGKVAETCYYKNGVLDGPWKCLFPSGRTQLSANYVDGKLDGYYQCWNVTTGAKSVEGMYSHGKCVGEWKTYEDNGVDYRILHYDAKGNLLDKEAEKARIVKLYNKYDAERGNLRDPEHYVDNPTEYRP
jgi:antitoxin component YwqK of YwqJK toxin-antitoxin module